MTHQPPQIIHGLSNADYHALPSVSKSGLDLIRKAPILFKHRRENPTPQTEAMRMGTLVHKIVLEPDSFGDEFVVVPKVDRRTAQGKADWAAFEIASEGKDLVNQDEWEQLQSIRLAVWAHPSAGRLLGELRDVEASIFWTDPDTGVECRCRPDGILNNGVIVDVKTTKDASPDEFLRSIVKYRYHVQAAYYGDGYQAVFGKAPKGFAFIAVEPAPPHLVAVYVASAEMVLRGRTAYQADLGTYARCVETGEWPGLSTEPIILDLPKWAGGQGWIITDS